MRVVEFDRIVNARFVYLKSGAIAIHVASLPQLPCLSGLATRALLRLHAEYRVQDSLGRVDLQREYAKLVTNVREGGREGGRRESKKK